MAVSEMKKLSCIVSADRADRLIASMQRLASVEIVARDNEAMGLQTADMERAAEYLSKDITCVHRAIEFLMVFDQRKYSLFDPPPEASIDDFDSGLDVVALAEAKAACELKDRMDRLKSSIADVEAALSALYPWAGIKIALPEDSTAHTVSVGGTLPSNINIDAMRDRLENFSCIAEIVQDTGKGAKTVCVTAYKDDFDSVRSVLSSFGFARCTVAAGKEERYADGVISKYTARLNTEKAELEACEKDAVRLADKLPDIKALYDVLSTRKRRLEAKAVTGKTDSTAVLCGWVPKNAVCKVEQLLENEGAVYEFEDPAEEDDVPVVLSNNAFSRNFEPIVSMYALPLYGRFDPTMLVSLFYAVIFGLMFADVGYGLILLAGCLAGLRLLHPKEGMKKLLNMFAICSVACIIAGVLFGGYFGDLPNALMKGFGGREDTKSLSVWFDMVENPMAFLIVSLAVGVIHMACGMVVKFIILCRDGHVLDAIFDVGSWLVLFAGIGVCFVSSAAGLAIAGAGALMLVCTQGRHEKKIIMKIAKGVMSLYDIVSYASDLLSYSRILALGLASTVIANVVNLLATMGGATVPGVVMFIFIFLIGHVINFLVNILGTYVHTSRLQYIEFFGKFYESGGREFAPLAPEEKYVSLR